jgi:hypothetical protein
MRRDFTTDIDRDIFQGLSRVLNDGFSHGLNFNLVTGGLETGQTALQSVFAESAVQNCALGSLLMEPVTGRWYKYSKAGGSGLAVGLMCQAAEPVTNYEDEVQTGFGMAAGATSGTILITTGATPAVNLFKDGWLVTNDGPGEGYAYPIATSGSHATQIAITLKSGYSIIVAFDATSDVSLVPNPQQGTIVVPVTTPTAGFAGVPAIAVTANYFYWSQIKGPCPMFVDTGDSVAIGDPVGVPATNAVPGAIGVAVTAKQRYGTVRMVGAADEIALVDLDLAA